MTMYKIILKRLRLLGFFMFTVGILSGLYTIAAFFIVLSLDLLWVEILFEYSIFDLINSTDLLLLMFLVSCLFILIYITNPEKYRLDLILLRILGHILVLRYDHEITILEIHKTLKSNGIRYYDISLNDFIGEMRIAEAPSGQGYIALYFYSLKHLLTAKMLFGDNNRVIANIKIP